MTRENDGPFIKSCIRPTKCVFQTPVPLVPPNKQALFGRRRTEARASTFVETRVYTVRSGGTHAVGSRIFFKYSLYFSKALSYGVYFCSIELENYVSLSLQFSVHRDSKCRNLKMLTPLILLRWGLWLAWVSLVSTSECHWSVCSFVPLSS